MAIYEVDPKDFAPSMEHSDSAGEVRTEIQLMEQESEHPERMEVLRMGIEERLASATGETGLFERLHEYFLKESANKSRPLQARASH